MAEPTLLGRRLRAYRRRARMTQQQLSKASGVPRITISLVESGGQNSLSLDALIRIADVLGLSLDQLARPNPDDAELAAASA